MATVVVDHELEQLLVYLKRTRGFDFTGYKRPSLVRRINKRMVEVGATTFPEYTDYLEVHPEEFGELFNTILINVTRFFRDEAVWQHLAAKVLPELVKQRGETGVIRVWTAGCATGEEAYTLAMLFAEALGQEAFRERVKIYATDADEESLTRARSATYTAHEVEGVPEPLLARYFDRFDSNYVFKKECRRQVIFGRHDLVQDAPISRVDLLTCRNVLMYFNAETQARILARFHFALNDNGVLVLGRAETLLSHGTTFAPVDLKQRISTKVPRGSLSLRDRLMLAAHTGTEDAGAAGGTVRMRELAIDAGALAQVVVEPQGTVAIVNERARQLFGIGADDVGRPLQDLRISYRPVELRSLIDQVTLDRRPARLPEVEHRTATGESRWLEVQVTPLLDGTDSVCGVSVTYGDVTATRHLNHDLERAQTELGAAYEELQSTNEELETTNEELQSTVEELETTNEELQSTNEELETMNEELQSSNEELTTINEELRQRSDELNQVNAFFTSVLAGLQGGVAVVDHGLHVLVWNERATDMWGLRADEATGRHVFGLDIGLPLEQLREAIRTCLSSGDTPSRIETVDAINRRGRPIRCRVSISQLLGVPGQPSGVILVMEDVTA